ncbi:MAG: DUF692 domain-containing protein [Sneathiellaceae bacterium]
MTISPTISPGANAGGPRAPIPAHRCGIGLRAPHHAAIVADRPPVGWLEVHAENYMCGGPPRRYLEAVRRDWPLSIHGVGLSLGSAAAPDPAHLDRLARLVAETEPALVSEHLAWSVAGGTYLNDLLPLPYTEESLAIVAANIGRVQDRLGRPILLENPSTYLRFATSTVPEGAFLAALAQRTGCRLLCDVNNIAVNAHNHGEDPQAFLAALPADAVAEIHLAGYHENRVAGTDGTEQVLRIDDHGSAVAADVWPLYAAAVRRFPDAASLVEWDSRIPPLERLVAQAALADRHRADALGISRPGRTASDDCAA